MIKSVILLFITVVFGTGMQLPQKISEEQKIEHLIAFIAKQKGVFIRNDGEYTPAQAAEHLRMKRKKAGKQIKTAREFIDLIAAKSSMTGKPYVFKLPNGKSTQVGPLLHLELNKLEQGNHP